jgi:hypothetical protein
MMVEGVARGRDGSRLDDGKSGLYFVNLLVPGEIPETKEEDLLIPKNSLGWSVSYPTRTKDRVLFPPVHATNSINNMVNSAMNIAIFFLFEQLFMQILKNKIGFVTMVVKVPHIGIVYSYLCATKSSCVARKMY